MNIIIVHTTELKYSRVESSRILHLSNELAKMGIKTIIIGRKSDNLDDALAGDNIIPVKPLIRNGFLGNFILTIQIQMTAMYVILAKNIDKALIRGYDLIFIIIFLKLINRPIICDFHGYRYKEQVIERKVMRSKITKIFDWFMLTFSERIIVITEALCESMPLNLQRKSLILPNGVDIQKFDNVGVDKTKLVKYNVPTNKKIVGFIGNWEAWLNMEELFSCAKYLENNAVMLIIGQGQNYEIYKQKYSNIIFTGRVPHKDAVVLLKAMDVCIHPYSDNIIMKNTSPRKTLEYLAAGKPIVGGDVDGREKFLKEGENILLYEPGNARDLANKIQLLLKDDILYKKMCENNRKLSKEFTWERLIEKSGLLQIIR